ncbi:MAG: hypothetical protein C4516_01980 [Oxalobacter sp.]|nr:MAG: hypothetical protein C4516_01980 [Oxalobacter sp.]
MARTLIAMMQTRAELLAVEIEEEVLRLFAYLMLSLVALFCFGIAALLAIALIIILFWDTHRIAVVIGLIGVFGVAGVVIMWQLNKRLHNKPRFLSATLNEMSKDLEALKPSDGEVSP